MRGFVAAATVLTMAVAPSVLLAGPAAADTCANATTWTGAGLTPGDWSDAGNWSSGVPDDTYSVTIGMAGGDTISDSTNPASDPVCDLTIVGSGTALATLSAPVTPGGVGGHVAVTGSPVDNWSLSLPSSVSSVTSFIVDPGAGGTTAVTVGALSSTGALTVTGGSDAQHAVTLSATSLSAPTVTALGTVTLDATHIVGAINVGDGTTATTLTVPSSLTVDQSMTVDRGSVVGTGALTLGGLSLSGTSSVENAATVNGDVSAGDGATATLPASTAISGQLSVVSVSAATGLTLTGTGPTAVSGLTVDGGTLGATVNGGLTVTGPTHLDGASTLTGSGTTLNGTVDVTGVAGTVRLPADVVATQTIAVKGTDTSAPTVLELASTTSLPNGVSVNSNAAEARLSATGPVTLGSLTTIGTGSASSSLTGPYHVTGAADLSGPANMDGDVNVDGELRIGTTNSAAVQLADGSHLVADGVVKLGTAIPTMALLQGPSSPTTTPRLSANQGIMLQTSSSQVIPVIRVGLDLATNTSLDVRGHVLSITGPSTSTFADATAVKDTASVSTSTTGVVNFLGSSRLVLGGTTTITSPATLRLSAASTLDGAAATTTFTGTGLLSWQGGAIVHDLTLDVSSKIEGVSSAADRRVASGVSVTNLGTMDFVSAAALGLDGTLDNRGRVTLRASDAIGGTGRIVNEAGKILEIAAPGSNTTGGAVTVTGPSLRNFGTLTLPAGDTLKLLADPAVSGSGGGSLLADAGKIAGGGVLQVGAGATMTMRGKTTFAPGADITSSQQTFKQPAILLVDDGGGSPASLIGDPDAPATLTGTAVTDGALVWCSGTLSGSVTVNAMTSQVGTGLYGPACGNTHVAVLAGDTTHKASLALNGPTSVNSERVSMLPHSQVTLGGATTFGGNPTGFDHGTAAVDDELLTVAKGASVTVASLSLTRPNGQTTSSTKGTIDVPFVNHGSFTANGSPIDVTGSLLDTDGTFTVAGTTVNVPSAPLTNEGTVTVQGSGTAAAKFAVPKGYTQSARSGLTDPVTGVFANATLTTNDGAGHTTPVAINAGGMGGDGTIEASSVSMGKAWLHPGTSAASGTMTIKGALALSGGSDLQIVIRAPASGTTTPVHDLLKVSGAATISGQITGITASGYKPAYLAIVKDVFDFASHTGTFTKTSWSGTPTGLGWKPMTLTSTAKQVDLQLVDVAPPSLGIASIPAFTEFASQRVTYAAVDNRTGVKSYDVRWRSGDPTHAFSHWHYPAPWQRTRATYETKSGLAAGWEYCFSVRSRDGAGNITPWSVPLCTARVLDDHVLVARGSWTRPTGKAGFYVKTYSKTTRLGAYLTRAPGTFTRVGVIAYACPKCGVVGIYSGKTLLKKWSLRSSKPRLANWISPLLKSRYARLTIKSLTSRKQVVIDAVGLMR